MRPDTADSFQEYPYDLVLSGHSHGGQVNIPFIPASNQKAISLLQTSLKYVSGNVVNLNSKTKIYVNTGIGTTCFWSVRGCSRNIYISYLFYNNWN